MSINPAVLGTLAALVGSAIGATAPILSNYVLQRGATQRELLNHQIAGREALYSDFIRAAARLYAHSLSNGLESIDDVVGLFALVARIRLLSSEPVVAAADKFLMQIMDNYGQPNMTLDQMRSQAAAEGIDPLHEFSRACRFELARIFSRGSTNV